MKQLAAFVGGASAGPVETGMGQIQLHWLGLASADKGAVNNLNKLETGRNHEDLKKTNVRHVTGLFHYKGDLCRLASSAFKRLIQAAMEQEILPFWNYLFAL